MRMSRILIVSLLGLPLGGCLGVTIPPQPLPDWAMNRSQSDQAAGTPKKQRVVRQRALSDFRTAENTEVTSAIRAAAQPAAHAQDSKPFAPGWDTPEDERDPSLRRTMNICRNC
jgi:hypothetical protein